MRNKIEVQGHRGTRGLVSENTVSSFKSAMDAGADVLELDLGVTADKVLIVSHDPYINPELCLDPDGNPIKKRIFINELTKEEVQKYDCGTLKNKDFEQQVPVPGARIPTLEEVFDLVRDSKIKLNLEIKIFDNHPVPPQEFAKLLYHAVQGSKLGSRINVQSFDPRPLEEIKKLDSQIRTAILAEASTLEKIAKIIGFSDLDQHPEGLMIILGKMVGAETISPHYKLLNLERIQTLKNNGFKVIPWTVNQPEEWDSLIEMGVDGIITDYPKALIEFMKR